MCCGCSAAKTKKGKKHGGHWRIGQVTGDCRAGSYSHLGSVAPRGLSRPPICPPGAHRPRDAACRTGGGSGCWAPGAPTRPRSRSLVSLGLDALRPSSQEGRRSSQICRRRRRGPRPCVPCDLGPTRAPLPAPRVPGQRRPSLGSRPQEQRPWTHSPRRGGAPCPHPPHPRGRLSLLEESGSGSGTGAGQRGARAGEGPLQGAGHRRGSGSPDDGKGPARVGGGQPLAGPHGGTRRPDARPGPKWKQEAVSEAERGLPASRFPRWPVIASACGAPEAARDGQHEGGRPASVSLLRGWWPRAGDTLPPRHRQGPGWLGHPLGHQDPGALELPGGPGAWPGPGRARRSRKATEAPSVARTRASKKRL